MSLIYYYEKDYFFVLGIFIIVILGSIQMYYFKNHLITIDLNNNIFIGQTIITKNFNGFENKTIYVETNLDENGSTISYQFNKKKLVRFY